MNKILLYPCNIVGYVRLFILFSAITTISLYNEFGWPIEYTMRWGLAIWIFIGAALDFIDGHLARKYGHTTKFGALLELSIDMLTHTTVWILSGLKIAWFLIAFEWLVALYLAAFTLGSPQNWKDTLVKQGWWLIRVYFKPMKYNAFCEYCNLAHFVFPMVFFVCGSMNWVGYLALPGLVVYEVVTVGMLRVFLGILLQNEETAETKV